MPPSPPEVTIPSEPAGPAASGDGGDSDEAYCAACNQSFGFDHRFCPNDGSRLVKLKAQPDALLGRVFDERYEIRSALGHGGMGTVYRGWQRSVDREVAIKVIHPRLAAQRPVAKRFLREARLASRLNQPNIINVYDFGQTDDGILYLVMELLRGRSLARDLEAHRPLPVRRIAAIALQICDALDAAHGQGIIHRDLKPHNIVVLDDPPGRDLLKILDFGLAKSLVQDSTSLVTQSDALLGTPLYMPPEQILGRQSDQRADLYSLGCILYQMVSGRPPFIGENINVVLGAHIRELPPPLPDDTPPQLAATILHLMSKAPEDRPATASLVRDAIAALATGASTPPAELAARPATTPPAQAAPPSAAPASETAPGSTSSVHIAGARRRRSRRRWLLALSAAVVAIGFGATFAMVWRWRSRSSPPDTGASTAGTGSLANTAGSATDPAGAAPQLDAGIAADAPISPDAALSIDAQVPVDARVRVDAGVPFDARPFAPPPDARAPAVIPHSRKLDAGISPAPPADAAAPPAPDAGMPDLDLLPTRRGSHR